VVFLTLVMAEEEGFEPPRASRRLSVFKTDPFSQTWVLLRIDIIKYSISCLICQHIFLFFQEKILMLIYVKEIQIAEIKQLPSY
jgi:hypothetical protein